MSANFNDKDLLTIAFGRGHLSLSLPPEAAPTVVRKRSLPKLPDAAGTIAQAFHTPIGSAPLGELAQGKTSACILICDITRPGAKPALPAPDDRELVDAGIPLDRITVLVATGLHRPNRRRGTRRAGGRPVGTANVRVENHFARDEADHVDFGRTATRGTPVKIDRRFVGG